MVKLATTSITLLDSSRLRTTSSHTEQYSPATSATGLAARELAKNGSGLVNTNGESNLTADERKKIRESSNLIRSEFDKLVDLLTAPSDSNAIDSTRLNAALAKAPGQDISDEIKTKLKAAQTIPNLKTVLNLYSHDVITKPLLETLTAK